MAALQVLVGHTVSEFRAVHEYIQLVFSNGTTLSIFNDYVYKDDGGTPEGAEGKRVKSVEESIDAVTITFEGSGVLSIGLRDNDYNGPEAMVLKQEGRSPIVWN